MLIALVGPSGAGKSAVQDLLYEKLNDYGYVKPLGLTSRGIRVEDGEIDGIDYKFTTREQIIELDKKGLLANISPYNGDLYGYLMEDIQSIENGIFTLEVSGFRQFNEKGIEYKKIYVDLDEETRIKRMMEIRGDSREYVERKVFADRETGILDLINEVDYIADNRSNDPEDAVNKIFRFLFPEAEIDNKILDEIHNTEDAVEL